MRALRTIWIATALLLGVGLTMGFSQSTNQGGSVFSSSLDSDFLKINFYPNPATEILNVTVSSGSIDRTAVEIFNIIGNKIDVSIEQVSGSELRINIDNLTPGYYLLAVRSQNARTSQSYKFLKR